MPTRGLAWILGILIIGLGIAAPCAQAKDNPDDRPPWQRMLKGEDAKKAEDLEKGIAEFEAKAQFTKAIAPAKELLALRERVQGKDHWQTADARRKVETLATIAAMPKGKQAELAKTRAMRQEAIVLIAKGKYTQAKQLIDHVLSTQRDTLGAEHADTTISLTDLVFILRAKGEYAEAQTFCRQALGLRQNVLGEEHRDTARSYSNLAYLLDLQGKNTEAETLYRKSLELYQRLLGEEHPETATIYNNLAFNLDNHHRHAEAELIHRKTLELRRKLLGEENGQTASSYNNLAFNLDSQGNHAQAEPLYRKALELYQRLFGEGFPDTAACYNNLAANLNAQAKFAEAELLYRKALDLRRKLLGEEHPETAATYNSLGSNFDDQGKVTQAEPYYRKALDLRRKLLGEEHPQTAQSYNNLATNLDVQGRQAEAEPLARRALELYCRLLGEGHPDAAASYGNLATNLSNQGKLAQAEPFFRKAIEIDRKHFGEKHPHSGLSYYNLAFNLYSQGKYAQAETHWTLAAQSFNTARLRRSIVGIERSLSPRSAPFRPLAALAARRGAFDEAFKWLEQEIGRGLWDDLDSRQHRQFTKEEKQRQQALLSRLHQVDTLLENPKNGVGLEPYRQEQLKLQAQLAKFQQELVGKYGPAQGQQYSLSQIQKQLPVDNALVAWLDIPGQPKAADPDGEHWALVVRSQGEPNWIKLKGTGFNGAWTKDDHERGQLLARLLANACQAECQQVESLTQILRKQRINPIFEGLKAGSASPPIRRLIVLPSPALSGLPIEVLFTVSPSTSPAPNLLASSKPRSLEGIAQSEKGYENRPTHHNLPPQTAGLKSFTHDSQFVISYAPSGTLYAWLVKQRSSAKTRWQRKPTSLLALGDPSFTSNRSEATSEAITALPGTRKEIETIAAMFGEQAGNKTILLGSDASEQKLSELARSGNLKTFRYLHFATHGVPDPDRPMRSRLLLARDNLPDPLEQVTKGQEVFTGELTVEKVLRDWDLDADLVVLSACESALGRKAGGEGHLGFAQALILAGARSLVLSLWKVNDAATSLLMQRFYQNLLGTRPGLSSPMPKAEALHEAKQWLRTVEMDKAELDQMLRGYSDVDRGQIVMQLEAPKAVAAEPAKGNKKFRPFEHPYYWAAFILIGDPD